MAEITRHLTANTRSGELTPNGDQVHMCRSLVIGKHQENFTLVRGKNKKNFDILSLKRVKLEIFARVIA